MTEHLIVSVGGEVKVVPASIYHMLPDSAKPRVLILASCPDSARASYVRSHLPKYCHVGDLIGPGAEEVRHATKRR